MNNKMQSWQLNYDHLSSLILIPNLDTEVCFVQ